MSHISAFQSALWPQPADLYPPVVPESKSPMNYAVDYKLVDEDGQLMESTDYFITSDEAWDRAKELYELSGLEGTITFRAL